MGTDLANGTENHEQTAEEEVSTHARRAVTDLRASEVHEVACERRESQQESYESSVRRVREVAWQRDLFPRDEAYTGVGLPTVLRRSPLTWFWGER